MSLSELEWDVISRRLINSKAEPSVWAAEFGQGYLVVHASPTDESMVYVPHALSGLGATTDQSLANDLEQTKTTLRWCQNDLARLREQHSMMLDDLASIGEALGVNVAARPDSPHVVVAEIIEAAKALAKGDDEAVRP